MSTPLEKEFRPYLFNKSRKTLAPYRGDGDWASAVEAMGDIANRVKGTREDILWFAVQMELKLRENDYKGGYPNEPFIYFMRRIGEELHGLDIAVSEMRDVFHHQQFSILPYYDAIIREAADIANFAMMIASKAQNCREEYEKKEELASAYLAAEKKEDNTITFESGSSIKFGGKGDSEKYESSPGNVIIMPTDGSDIDVGDLLENATGKARRAEKKED